MQPSWKKNKDIQSLKGVEMEEERQRVAEYYQGIDKGVRQEINTKISGSSDVHYL